MLARNPRLVYASISGYGQTGPWMKRRAYAPVVEAEAGIIASQSASHGGPLSKDPHSHADVYTAIETTSAILAALYQRERTGVGQGIDVSMAETMLYVNEHLHDSLWEGDDDPNWIRSFRPGDYLVLTVANGESLVVSGHPAERGTFDFFLAAMGRPELVDDPRFVDVAVRLANFDALATSSARSPPGSPMPTNSRRSSRTTSWPSAGSRQPGELTDDRVGNRSAAWWSASTTGRAAPIRVPNVPWRFSAAPDVAVSGLPKYRGEDNRPVLAELLGFDDDRLDELEADGVLSSRIPRS